MDAPKRTQPRLKGYDYSANGAYFLTLCARNRARLFGCVVGAGVPDGPDVDLTFYGKIVQTRLEEMSRFYSDLHLDHYVIMPNHIHIMLTLDGTCGPSGTPAPTNARIPAFVSALKRLTNREAGTDLWQRSYHDHIIRDENDFLAHWSYIDGNAARWSEDEYYTNT